MRIFKAEIKIIPYLYYLLFFSVPLVFYHKTSEVFEFNKMVTTYFITILIVSFWIIKMVIAKKIIFRRTALDIPILFFLVSQTLSTLISVDQRTSLLGYYSRFNGGLFSSISYAILYWGLVSNLDFGQTKKLIKVIFASLLISSIWAVFEHFGHSFSCYLFPEYRTFDVSCWVQDVAWRVYSTFGQPNWLAAYLAALIPLTWGFAFKSNSKDQMVKIRTKYLKILPGVLLSSIFFTTLLFTKSRSGILGFLVSWLLFWSVSGIFWLKSRNVFFDFISVFLVFNTLFLILIALIGTPWTPNLKSMFQPSEKTQQAAISVSGPALEVGGTASGVIRKIVWKGAVDIWKNYPILGTGVETFAFSYYNYRPAEHNLTSEWDYLYNKAHNEYLNYAATTGTLGLISYLTLILATIFLFLKSSLTKNEGRQDSWVYGLAFLSGYTTILITNFFGFSVVPVALLFFLFPAMAITLGRETVRVEEYKSKEISSSQKILIIFSCFLALILLYSIGKYWYADLLYADGKNQGDAGNYAKSLESLNAAIKFSPKESVYWEELATTTGDIAVGLSQQENTELANSYMAKAIDYIKTAISLSPANVNLKRTAANVYINLSVVEPNLILATRDALAEAVKQAPTDAKLFYNLGYAYIRTGESDKAIDTLKKTIELKSDYRNAYYALGLVYVDLGKKDKAKEQFEYILKNINPGDSDAKTELENLNL
ncbi:hypothetical protein A2962_01830 [Candidatus Woesebacteria bacterium RIFCSPLOWO2_01_FULL_39_61]|uniref:O-antigen ligase-related domain-containing protein n=1 Tax=Candidatus Woesebacteria bacterium RIFCSPHIGHO2_02_FULL_39_13 TaxID=1802505 RepID=A0A1F7Z257_9BACT|nr:MAG: hypothetical protein A3D01_06330 [Candidatus Woesebacteria bacterium RIFCSPHIGHO2_02_FULL_39_13]OGM66769.1 MAG: hypothetical protein A2962_01830 [Candidatus Woesebacteria bacterium RIFCSPLOWO2_01_FULL_39_61]